MNTVMSRTTCLISHSNRLTEIDFIIQNIEYSLRNDNIRLHGILSPFSKSYEYTVAGLEKISSKLNQVYGIKSLIVDISMAGDQGILTKINSLGLNRNEKGIFTSNDGNLNFLLLNKCLEQENSELLENLIFWKTVEESKKDYDILFLLPSIKNNRLIEQLDINAEAQWLFVEKKNSTKIYKNLKDQVHFQVPFFGLVTV